MKTLYLLLFATVSFTLAQAQSNTIETIQHGGLTREYRLYVPAMYDGSQAVPVVFNLHGYTSNAQQQELYGNFTAIADTANFIVVHPEGTLDGGGEQWWNAFGAASPDDVGFVSAMIDELDQNYNINLNRVYSTGMSNGGYMSFELACQLGNRIAAVASVTGAMNNGRITACNAPKPTPIMQIHGTQDPTVAYNGAGSSASIPDVVDYWVNQTNSNPTPTVTNMPDIDMSDGSTAEHYLYTGGDQNTTVEHFKIINGAHTWPGAPIDIGVTNHDIDASIEIWRFFSQYSLNNLLSVEQEQPKDMFKLYPNPSDGVVNIEFDKSVNSFVIVDALGREILKEQNIQTKETIEIKQKGVYFIQFESNSGLITKKFIVK